MSTYAELMKQANELMEKAEQQRKTELQSVIVDIKAKMREYGITVADLGGSGSTTRSKKTATVVKYRGPNGETWSGGPGRKPDWVRNVLASGESIEKYAV